MFNKNSEIYYKRHFKIKEKFKKILEKAVKKK